MLYRASHLSLTPVPVKGRANHSMFLGKVAYDILVFSISIINNFCYMLNSLDFMETSMEFSPQQIKSGFFAFFQDIISAS